MRMIRRIFWLCLYPVVMPLIGVLNRVVTGKWNWKQEHRAYFHNLLG